MADLFEVLDVIVADDPNSRGDFWRVQPWVAIPRASEVRPVSYRKLGESSQRGGVLAGKRFGVPAMYVNEDAAASWVGSENSRGERGGAGIGGPTGQPIATRPAIIDLWHAARGDLEAAGAEVVVVDFPVVSNYEADRIGAPSIRDRGLVSPEFLERELWDLSIWAWDDFLRANGDPLLNRLSQVDGGRIFPRPPGALPDRYGDLEFDLADYVARARERGVPERLLELAGLDDIEAGLRGLEETRRIDLEDWMDRLGLDAVLFPAVADVAPADADVNPASAGIAWRNGVWVANGNLVLRHLGIPTVTVPMGTMADIGMPVGLTFAGRAYDDTALLGYAAAFEAFEAFGATGQRRTAPPRTPALAN